MIINHIVEYKKCSLNRKTNLIINLEMLLRKLLIFLFKDLVNKFHLFNRKYCIF